MSKTGDKFTGKRLTKRRVDAARYEGHKLSSGGYTRHVLWDSELRGFGLRVFPSGRKTFIFKYRVRHRTRMATLGDYGPLTVDQARDEALRIKAKVEVENVDPLDERERLRGRATFGDLALAYIERHAKPHKRTWASDQYRLDRYLVPGLWPALRTRGDAPACPSWASRPVEEIRRSDVADFHRRMGEHHGPYIANRMVSLLAKMFECARDYGMLDEGAANPARGVKRFREVKRDRWVTPQELPELAKAIDAEPDIYVRSALWLYLVTGARKSELLRTKWEDVDLQRRELRIRGSKSGEDYLVPLSAAAVGIIEAIPRQVGNPYLLPGHRRGGHLVNIEKPWRRVRTAAGVKDVRLHDLRRTLGAWLAESGHSLLLIGKALGHKSTHATAVYARLSNDPVRTALEAHGERLMAIARPTPDGGGDGQEEAPKKGEIVHLDAQHG